MGARERGRRTGVKAGLYEHLLDGYTGAISAGARAAVARDHYSLVYTSGHGGEWQMAKNRRRLKRPA